MELGPLEGVSDGLQSLLQRSITNPGVFMSHKWSVYCSALNSACVLASVLSTWSDLPMFTELVMEGDNPTPSKTAALLGRLLPGLDRGGPREACELVIVCL